MAIRENLSMQEIRAFVQLELSTIYYQSWMVTDMKKHTACNIMGVISLVGYWHFGGVEYQAYAVACILAGMICGAIESK